MHVRRCVVPMYNLCIFNIRVTRPLVWYSLSESDSNGDNQNGEYVTILPLATLRTSSGI